MTTVCTKKVTVTPATRFRRRGQGAVIRKARNARPCPGRRPRLIWVAAWAPQSHGDPGPWRRYRGDVVILHGGTGDWLCSARGWRTRCALSHRSSSERRQRLPRWGVCVCVLERLVEWRSWMPKISFGGTQSLFSASNCDEINAARGQTRLFLEYDHATEDW